MSTRHPAFLFFSSISGRLRRRSPKRDPRHTGVCLRLPFGVAPGIHSRSRRKVFSVGESGRLLRRRPRCDPRHSANNFRSSHDGECMTHTQFCCRKTAMSPVLQDVKPGTGMPLGNLRGFCGFRACNYHMGGESNHAYASQGWEIGESWKV